MALLTREGCRDNGLDVHHFRPSATTLETAHACQRTFYLLEHFEQTEPETVLSFNLDR